MTPLEELLEACRAFLPDNPDDTYEDADSGETYRTCCFARIRFYPHDTSNPHAADCRAIRLAAALESFTALQEHAP